MIADFSPLLIRFGEFRYGFLDLAAQNMRVTVLTSRSEWLLRGRTSPVWGGGIH